MSRHAQTIRTVLRALLARGGDVLIVVQKAHVVEAQGYLPNFGEGAGVRRSRAVLCSSGDSTILAHFAG